VTGAQKNIVVVACLVIAAMGVFPPWLVEGTDVDNRPAVITDSAGYAPLWSPPRQLSPRWFSGWRVDLGRLSCQWIAVLAVAAALLAYSRPPVQRLQ
jgi:hypothetical protein